jgi:hypothetical protein
MTARSAEHVRGCLVATYDDRNFVFRVYGQPDSVTGRREFTDYELAVDDLWIEITSEYYYLYEREYGEAGNPFVVYRREVRL